MSDKKSRIEPVADSGHDPAAAESWSVDSRTFGCLARMVQDFGSTLELREVLQNVAQGIKAHVQYDTFAVLLLDDLGRQLRFGFAVGFSDEVVRDWRFGLGQGIVGTVAMSQKPMFVNDVSSEPRFIDPANAIAAELAVPLVVKNRTIGVLDVGSYNKGHFTDEHLRLLTFVAGHVANGIENARLYENVRDQARTLSLLHETSRELTSILDQEKLLRKVAELVKRLIDYQLFSVMLWDDETHLLEHTFSLRYDERFVQKGGFPLGRGVTGTAAALRQPLRVPNVHLSPHYTDCGHGVEVRSELAIPLVFKDRLIGVLDLESVEYNAFSEEHEQMLATLGSYIAVALENARLYETVIRDERRLDEDLSAAREMQKALLTDEAPSFPGLDVGFAYHPARQLGGDFYDFLQYDEHRLAVAVGDVTGKGAAAALHGSLAIGMLRGHVVEHPCEPKEMLEDLNVDLRQQRLENRFVAMVYGLFDARTKKLTLANAGLTRPLLVRDGRVEQIELTGVPLGLLPDIKYDDRTLELRAGDIVVLGSDGITESVDRECEQFGARRMHSLLAGMADRSAAEIADELLAASQRFHSADSGDSDDRTVVILKVR